MSGGRFDYQNDNAAREIFGWSVDVNYGLGEGAYETYVKRARRLDPMEDKQLSELVYDVFCLLHSLDWYKSDDTGEETYRADVAYFKQKWLKGRKKSLEKAEIDKQIDELREDLYCSLLFDGGASRR